LATVAIVACCNTSTQAADTVLPTASTTQEPWQNRSGSPADRLRTVYSKVGNISNAVHVDSVPPWSIWKDHPPENESSSTSTFLFLIELQKSIEANWAPPLGAESEHIVVRCNFHGDDSADIKIETSCGRSVADNAAVEAIQKSSMSQTLPADKQNHLVVSVAFDYVGQNVLSKAIDESTSIISSDPTYTRAYLCRAKVYAALKRFPLAVADCKACKAISEKGSKNKVVTVNNASFAEMVLDNLDNPDASPTFDSESRFDATRVANTTLDSIYSEMESLDASDAVLEFSKLIAADPNDNEAYTGRAKAEEKLKQFPEAISDYENAINALYARASATHAEFTTPNDLVSIYELLAIACEQSGQPDKFFEYCSGIIGKSPNEVTVYAGRAYVRSKAKHWTDAIADCNKTIDLKPDATWGYYWRAFCEMSSNNFVAAEADSRKVIDLQGKSCPSLYYCNLGTVYEKLGRYQDAILVYTQAISRDGRDSIAFSSRARTYNALKQYEKAIADSDVAISIFNANPWAYMNRAYANFQLGKHEKAIADCAQAVTAAPKNSRARDYLADLKNGNGLKALFAE